MVTVRLVSIRGAQKPSVIFTAVNGTGVIGIILLRGLTAGRRLRTAEADRTVNRETDRAFTSSTYLLGIGQIPRSALEIG